MYQRQVDYLCARLAFYNWCQWEEEILHQLSCQRPKPWRPWDLHLISWKSNIWIFCQLGNGCPTNVSNWSSLQWKGWYFGFFSRLPYFHLLKMYCCIKLESRKFGICCLERNWISEEKAKGRKKCIKWILFFCLLSAHILIETKCKINKNWDFGPKTLKSIFTEKLILETDERKASQSLLCNNLQESQKSFLLKKIYWKEKAFLDFQFWVFLF